MANFGARGPHIRLPAPSPRGEKGDDADASPLSSPMRDCRFAVQHRAREKDREMGRRGNAGARGPLIRLPAPSPRGEKGDDADASPLSTQRGECRSPGGPLSGSAPSPRLRFAQRTSPRGERGTADLAATPLLPSGRRCRQADEGAACPAQHRINHAAHPKETPHGRP
jgi:hypothetical protein